MSLVKTITRALTHSLSPTLVETLSKRRSNAITATFANPKVSQVIVHCGSRTTTEQRGAPLCKFLRGILLSYYSVITQNSL